MSNQMGTYTEVSKLVGTGAIGSAIQGASVKLSEDGNFLFIGGYSDNSGIGAVWFYQKVNGVWTQKQKIVPTGYSGSSVFLGWSLTVNPSMTTLIVGAYLDGSQVGASFVFTFDGTTWTQQGNKLVGNGRSGTSGSLQGQAVALSADGNTAITGGPGDGNFVGAAWIFVRTGITWSQQGSKLVGTGNSGKSYQGYAVALTSDGNLAVVGGYNDQDGIGALWVHHRSGISWNQAGTKVAATGEVGVGLFGSSLALSGDDQTLVVGGYQDNSYVGATWVFKLNGSAFIQFGNKLVGTGASSNSWQGYSVAVNKLGTLVVVGAVCDLSNAGAVFVYAFDGTNYNQLGNKIVAADAIGSAYQGQSVSLDSSGSQLLFGGYGDNGSKGAAWIYKNAAITSSPSAAPTSTTTQPSFNPTTQPSLEPTAQPSVGPTTEPSMEPTTQPSVGPTTQPSLEPTTQPSLEPTTQPSVGPTTQPSVGPTTQPSHEPTTQPSAVPTTQPSVGPTTVPSISSTTQPSIQPTFLPTFAPSVKPVAITTSKPTTAFSSTSSGAFLSLVTVIPVLVLVWCALMYFFFRVYKKQVNKEGVEMKTWIQGNQGEIALYGKSQGGGEEESEVASMDNPLQRPPSSKEINLSV